MKIRKITKEKFSGKVYNFSVTNLHNYVVKNVVAHNCNYCYTSATKFGYNFDNIVEKAYEVWGSLKEEERPFQIAIGGAGESTIHPDWIKFVKHVKSLGIMPNYTTNGMHLSNDILQATEDYCGGVAVSYHPHIKPTFIKAVEKLSKLNTKLNAHIILGNEQSFKDMVEIYENYYDKLDYLVILPYQAAGRGKLIETHNTWIKAFNWLKNVNNNKFAFGALFYNWLLENEVSIKMSIYEPEIYSGYRMLDDNYKILFKSSYDLTPKFK